MKKFFKYLSKQFRYATVNRVIKFQVRRKQRAIERLNERESTVAKIVKAAISDKFNTLMIAPLSGTRYIRMPDEDMFIILGSSNVVISNHKFYYDIDISTTLSDYLFERFNRVLEHQRNSMEKEMLGNIQAGLSDIANHIDKKVKQHGSKFHRHILSESEETSMA